jgi:hypothetical protein
MKKIFHYIPVCLLLLVAQVTSAQFGLTTTKVRVINMIPNVQSNETGQDSEPNIAVNPADVNRMVGSAFTSNPTGAVNRAPVFISTDKGETWAMNNIVPSGNGATGDISLQFGTQGNTLYTGILRGGSGLRMNILRSADPFGAAVMETLVDRQGDGVDQPYVGAITSTVNGNPRDRVYVGNNDFNAANGRTATVDLSQNARTAPAPAGFTSARLEPRNTNGQDMPAIRTTVHSDGNVYAIYYRWVNTGVPNARCDVIVARDNNFGTMATPFSALNDPGDGLRGIRVATNRLVPGFPANLGANRLVASNMSIAVNPANSATVYIAWADRVGANDYTLHLRRSTNSGATWSADLLTITNATNPALAINSAGTVGYLYQQLINGRWETHFRRGTTTTWSDMILATTPDNNPAPTFQPYIGDYCDVMTVGRNFYGIFSASNIPDSANFPQGVKYQRNANFTTHQNRNLANTANVGASIDPFFFAVEQRKIIDPCLLSPWKCRIPDLSLERIRMKCVTEPCLFVDPVPKNCLVKFNCPGCEGPNILCPPYYHMYLDDFDPRAWDVTIVDRSGEPINFERNKTTNGIVLSFRPDKKAYLEKQIGDYYLVFEGTKAALNKQFDFKTRLEVSDYRYNEHVKFGR